MTLCHHVGSNALYPYSVVAELDDFDRLDKYCHRSQ